ASDTRFYAQQSRLMADTPDQTAVHVISFITVDKEIPADPILLLEEPDLLPDYLTLNNFFDTHETLHTALLAGQLKLRDAQGNSYSVGPESRSLFDLPGMFWLQLVCGLAGMVICLM